jgi:hypothetical protein
MTRILSLVLVLALVLGSVPVAFAAEETAGDKLKAAGFVAGDQDGNLNEDQPLTREQMMVLIAEMNGVKEEAATFGIPADFSDVKADDWFAPYVWYAFYQGWTAGMGDGSFGQGIPVDSKMAATFMLKALDYEVTDYNASVSQAASVGIEIAPAQGLTRGQGFEAMWSTVNLPKQGSDVALGVELGRLEAETTPVADFNGVVDAVKAVGASQVEVTFEDDFEAAAAEAATYVIVKKDTTEAVAVKSVLAIDTDVVSIETEELTAGAAYTLTVGETAKNFTAIAKETDAPKIDSIKGSDTNRVKVTFDSAMDRATAEDIANYSIDKIGTVTDAKLLSGNKVVELSVEGFTKTVSAKMTVENVLNIDGVAIKKVTKSFYPKFDTSAPKINKIVKAGNNVELVVFFTDDHGVDEAVAEDVANYSIEGLDVLKAVASKKAYDSTATDKTKGKTDDYFKKVVLTTSEQQAGKAYTLVISNLIDGSVAQNMITKDLKEDFRGDRADTTKPSPKTITALSETLVEVVFTEVNDLDENSALDIANYEVYQEKFDIVDAKFKDDDADTKTVHLTVSGMENKFYKISINNIADQFGNTMTTKKTLTVGNTAVVDRKSAATISKVVSSGLEKVVVTFDSIVMSETAEDPTNYTFNNDLGAATKATLGSDNKTVTLEVPKMTSNKKYTVTVDGVENYVGFTTVEVEASFIATATSLDTTAPEVDLVSYDNKGILRVEFNEEVRLTGATLEFVQVDDATNTGTLTAAYQTGDDDNVLIFDASKSAKMINGKQFDITKITVKDLAQNPVDYTANSIGFETASTDWARANDAIELESWTQEDAKTIYFYFGSEVKLADTAVTFASNKRSGGLAFTLKLDSDDKSIVIATAADVMKVDEELTIADAMLTDDVQDLIDRDIKALDTSDKKMTMTLEDDVKPVIVEVIAVNQQKIQVVYDENLSTKGSYSLTKESGAPSVAISSWAIDADDENIVNITLSGKLDSDYEYTIKQTGLAKDIAGNSATKEDDGFTFIGNDTEPVAATFEGVAVIAWNEVKFTGSSALGTSDEYYVTTSNGGVAFASDADKISATATAASATTKSVSVQTTAPLLKDAATYYIYKNPTAPVLVKSFAGVVAKDSDTTNTNTVITSGEIVLDTDDTEISYVVTKWTGSAWTTLTVTTDYTLASSELTLTSALTTGQKVRIVKYDTGIAVKYIEASFVQ